MMGLGFKGDYKIVISSIFIMGAMLFFYVITQSTSTFFDFLIDENLMYGGGSPFQYLVMTVFCLIVFLFIIKWVDVGS